MPEISALGISVDASEVGAASKQLDGLADAAGRAAGGAEKLKASTKDASAHVNAYGQELKRLTETYNPLDARMNTLIADQQRLTQALQAGAGAGLPNAVEMQKALVSVGAEIKRTEDAIKNFGNEAAIGFGQAISNSTRARQEIIVLAHEVLQGNFRRIPGSFMVLAESMAGAGHQLLFMGGALALAAGPVIALTMAIAQGHHEIQLMTNAMMLSGNAAGVTRGQMRGLAETLTQTTSATMGQAKEIVTAFVESGRMGAQVIAGLAEVSAKYAQATGEDAQKVAADFAKMFTDPTRGAEELAQKMNLLSGAELEHIRHLQAIGHEEEARIALLDKLKERIDQLPSSMGALESAWNTVRKAASSAWDAMMGLGRTQSIDQQLAAQQATVDALQSQKDRGGLAAKAGNLDAQLLAAQGLLATMKALRTVEQDEAAYQQAATVQNQQSLKVQEELNHGRDAEIRQLQERRQLLVENAGGTVEAQRRVAEIDKQIFELRRAQGADSRARQQAEIAGDLKVAEIQLKSQQDAIDGQLKLGEINQREHEQALLFIAIETNQAQQGAELRQLAVAGLDAKEKAAHEQRLRELQAEAEAIKAKGAITDQINAKAVDDAAEQSWARIGAAIQAAGAKEIETLQKALDMQRLHNAEIGKTKEQIELVRAAAQDSAINTLQAETDAVAALLQENDLNDQARQLYAGLLPILQAKLDILKQTRDVLVDSAAKEATTAQARAYEAEWRKALDFVDKGLSNFFVDLLEHGGDSFKQLWDRFKHYALQVIAEIASKQIIISLVGASSLGGAAGAAANTLGGGSGIGSIANLLSNGSSLYNGLAGGGGVIGAGLSAYGTTMSAGAMGAVAAGLEGTGIAGIASGVAGAGEVGASLMAGLSAGLAAVPVASWVALAAIAVYSIVNGMKDVPADRTASFGSGAGLGSGDPMFRGQSSFGTLGIFNDSWFSEADQGKEIKDFIAGLTGIDNAISAIVGAGMTEKIKATLANVVTTFDAGTEHTATSFGQIMQQRYSAVAHTISDELGGLVDNFTGTGEELGKFVLQIVGVHEALAKIDAKGIFGQDVTTTDFVNLTAAGGDVGQTFTNLVQVFTLTNSIAQLMGKSTSDAFGAVGLASAEMRQDLVDAMGGIQSATSQLSFFLQHFYTGTERSAMAVTIATGQVNAAFAQFGLAAPTSSAAFRDIVTHLDLTTEAGRHELAVLLAVAPAIVTLYGDVGTLGDTAIDTSAAVNAAADALQRVKDAVNGLDSSLYTSAQRNANNATNAPWLLSNANMANHGVATGFNIPFEQGHQGDIATYLHSQAFYGLTTEAQNLILAWVRGYIDTWGTADQVMSDFTTSTQSAADAVRQLATSAQQMYLSHLSPADRNAYYTGQVGSFNTAHTSDYAQFGLTAPTDAAGVMAFYAATRLLGPEAQHFGDIVITTLLPMFDGMSTAAVTASTSIQSLVNSLQEAGTATQIAVSAADALVSFVGGDKSTQLTTRLGILQGRFNAAQSDYQRYSSLGLAYNADVAHNTMDQLAPQINAAANALAHLTTLTAQYGADKASALFDLEEKYNGLFASFQNYPDVLATLNASFGQQWQAIINGTGTGVSNTLDQLHRLQQGLLDFVAQLKVGNLSPLSPYEKFQSAQATYQTDLGLSQGGNLDAMGRLQNEAQTLLTLGQQVYASTSAYTSLFNSVTGDLTTLGTATPDANGRLVAALPTGSTIASESGLASVKSEVSALRDSQAATNALLARIANNTARTVDAVAATANNDATTR